MHLQRTLSGFILILCLLCSCKSKEKSSAHPTAVQDADQVDENRRFMDACKEKIKGNLELAVTGFNDVLHVDPNNAAAHYELAGLYNAQGRADVALSHAKAAAQADPKNEWYLWLYAQILQDSHNNSEAAVQFQKLIQLAPIKLEYYYGYSDALLYQGKYKEAIKVYDEIEQKLGESEEVTLQKAKVYERIGEFDKSVAEIRKLISQNPEDTKYYVVLAQLFQDRSALYQSKGNTAKAKETNEKMHSVFTELLQKDPANPFAQLSLAEYYLGVEKYDSAYAVYKLALGNAELDIDSKVKVILKYYYESEKDPKLKAQCEELCRIVTETNPHEAKGHAVLADFLYREKRIPEARSEYRKSIDLDKSKYVLWNQLLILDSELNDYANMLLDSREAIELFPSQPIPYFFSGIAQIQSRKFPEAIEVLNEGLIYVLDNKPLESQFQANLGDAYYKIKDFKKSDESYDKALAVDPDNSYVLNNYSYYLSLRNESLDKAEKMSKRSNELEPSNANFQDTYAWILYRLGKYDQAKEWMDKVFKTAPDPGATMLEHYGDILYHLNQKEEALNYWQKAKAKGGASGLLDKKINERKLYE
ncbi:MAG TPA: tetratricopeptide repeat protein [Bacteroidia bacterium]|jgi:tetratricopeptide (TPR) repeat protein|nr:tetratricopeptide repeat protein [Bacteroidia bacterium]